MSTSSYTPSYKVSYGEKYAAVSGTANIAKALRADLKTLVKAGKLPRGLKVSVTIERFAGGSSITMLVKACPFQLQNADWLARQGSHSYNEATRFPRYTVAGKALLNTFERMMGAYNHDGSDSMVDYFDVRFYQHAELGRDLERAEKATIRGLVAFASWAQEVVRQ